MILSMHQRTPTKTVFLIGWKCWLAPTHNKTAMRRSMSMKMAFRIHWSGRLARWGKPASVGRRVLQALQGSRVHLEGPVQSEHQGPRAHEERLDLPALQGRVAYPDREGPKETKGR